MSALHDRFAAHLDSLGLKKWAWEPKPFCAGGHPRPVYAMHGDLCQDCLDAHGIDGSVPQSYPDSFRFKRLPRNFLHAETLIGALNAWADATDTGLSIARVPNTEEPWRVQIGQRPFWFGAELEETLLAAVVEAIMSR